MQRFDPDKLKEAREDRSLEVLASAVGVSRQTLSRWEKGETEPDASELAGLAAATGKPIDFFFKAA